MDVQVRAGYVPRLGFAAPEEPLEAEVQGTQNDLSHLDDADDPRHGDGADADGAHIFLEDIRGGHLGDQLVGHGKYGVVEMHAERIDEGNEDDIGQHRSGADDGGVSDADDVPQPEQRSRRLQVQHHAELFIEMGSQSPQQDFSRFKLVIPRAEQAYENVIDQAEPEGRKQGFTAPAARFTGSQDFGGGNGAEDENSGWSINFGFGVSGERGVSCPS